MNDVLTMPVASPYKSVAEELDVLRSTIRTICHSYLKQTEEKISGIQTLVVASGEEAFGREKLATAKTPAARRRASELLTRVHDLRDMLTLLRTMQVKPARLPCEKAQIRKIVGRPSAVATTERVPRHLHPSPRS